MQPNWRTASFPLFSLSFCICCKRNTVWVHRSATAGWAVVPQKAACQMRTPTHNNMLVVTLAWREQAALLPSPSRHPVLTPEYPNRGNMRCLLSRGVKSIWMKFQAAAITMAGSRVLELAKVSACSQQQDAARFGLPSAPPHCLCLESTDCPLHNQELTARGAKRQEPLS